MKILHVLYSGLGGHSSVVFSLIEADKMSLYNHYLIFFGIENVPMAYKKKCEELNIKYDVIIKKTGLDIKSYKKFYQILGETNPDSILLHSASLILPAWLYKMKTGTRLISIEHQSNHLKRKSEWLWSVLFLQASYKVVYLTSFYKDQIKNKLKILFKPKKAVVIGNGINIGLFRPLNYHEALVDNQVINIGMLSRLTKIKDHPTLFRAFKILLETIGEARLFLNIAGEGETKNELEYLAKELAIDQNVIFHGMISEQSANLFLNNLEVYVHATFGESMSTALMQAMACGKPIVASDVNGVNNMLIHNETGLLVPLNNDAAMASAIYQLLNDKEMAEKIAENARRTAVEKYSNLTMFKNYRQIFDP